MQLTNRWGRHPLHEGRGQSEIARRTEGRKKDRSRLEGKNRVNRLPPFLTLFCGLRIMRFPRASVMSHESCCAFHPRPCPHIVNVPTTWRTKTLKLRTILPFVFRSSQLCPNERQPTTLEKLNPLFCVSSLFLLFYLCFLLSPTSLY